MEENEERSMIEPRSFEKADLQELIRVLIEWINDELHHFRIIVQDIEEDLYDGQILQKLMEKLTGETQNLADILCEWPPIAKSFRPVPNLTMPGWFYNQEPLPPAADLLRPTLN